MGHVELALIGVGSLRFGPSILASLPHLNPGPNWTLRLFDTDLERLDLMDRLARLLLIADEIGPRIVSTDEIDDATQQVQLAIVSIGGNTAYRYWNPAPRIDRTSGTSLPSATPVSLEVWFQSQPQEGRVLAPAREGDPIEREARIRTLWSEFGRRLLGTARVLNLSPELADIDADHVLDWPVPPLVEQKSAVPHQILRWIRGEDRVEPFIDSMANSPVVEWLRRQVDPLT
ncbi:MAG: hypothetical protein HONBIEJF_02778 [Fimbriimonadaceae bacterium]|nr:hypothetical protein [Fimbriimonadaceae bacterium]